MSLEGVKVRSFFSPHFLCSAVALTCALQLPDDSILAELQCSELEELNLANCALVSDKCLLRIAKICTGLRAVSQRILIRFP